MEPLLDFLQLVGVNWPQFIAQCLVFLVVYLVLERFAFRPVIANLEERKRRIAASEEQIQAIRKQMEEADVRYAETLKKANQEAQRLIDEARGSSSALAERKKQEAIAEAEKIITKAQETSRLEHEQMMQDLKAQIGHLVIDTTSKVAGKVLSPEDQKRLSEEAARRVAA
ncbi:MAG: ATP synthase F0 subunit B [Verrucomicrobiales bacterium]